MTKYRLIIWICIPLFISEVVYGQQSERWYRVSIAGSPVGYLLEKNNTIEGRRISMAETNISIGRLGSQVKMETRTTHFEEKDQLTAIDTEMYFSNEKKMESAKVMHDSLIVESQGMKRSMAIDAKLTGPGLLQELIRKHIESNQDNFTYTTYSTELGIYLNGTCKTTGAETLIINDKEFNAIVVEERFQELPYSRKKWVAKNGMLLKSVEPSPFGDMEIVWTSKEKALSALENSVDLPEEQYGSTMAYSNHRLSHPRSLSSITVAITQKRPEFGFPDFSGEYQTVRNQSDTEVTLEIRKPEPGRRQVQQDDLEEYLAPNAFLDNSDTLLTRKTQEVTDSGQNDWEKVKLIVDWVRKNMSFDPGIALANSREVFRDLKGTCVSYAMLSATMCKAAGIPARFLMGYVYVDGAWGGHAWSEAYVSGQWIPIDAAVPNDTYIADAARFYMIRSSLKDGMGAANIAGMQLFGNIEVKISEFTILQETFKATGQPFVVTDGIYQNSGLNFNMSRLKGFEFTDLDRFYPETIVLKQTNGSSEIIVEHWTYGTIQDTQLCRKRILSIAEAPQKAGSGVTQIYHGDLVAGTNQSVAIIEDGATGFLSLTTTRPDHRELMIQALEAAGKGD